MTVGASTGGSRAGDGAGGAVLYTRVSTGEQAENGTSLETQRDVCAREAEHLGLRVVEVCEDAGVSGARYESRPGLARALELIEGGQASVLVAAKIDRIGRSAKVILDVAGRVELAGGEVVTGDMKLDKTPMGRMMRTMLAGWAELERDTIREKTMDGRIARVRKGIQTQRARSPYGYHIVTHADVLRGEYPADQVGHYVVVPDEALHFRSLCADYDSGLYGLQALARRLNGQGVLTKFGGIWRASTLRVLFRNPVYKGVAAYGKVDTFSDESRLKQRDPRTGRPYTQMREMRPADPAAWITWPVPALIDEALWERLNRRLRENNAARGGSPRQVRMLTGRVFCPVCGGGCTPRTGGSRVPSYQCSRFQRRYLGAEASPGGSGCDGTRYGVDQTERAVLGAVADALDCPGAIAAALAIYTASAASVAEGLAEERARVEAALTALAGRQQAAVRSQVAGVLAGAEPAAYDAVFAELRQQTAALKARRDTLLAAPPAPPAPDRAAPVRDMTAILAEVRRVLTAAATPGATKRDILAPVVARVFPLPAGARTLSPRRVPPHRRRQLLRRRGNCTLHPDADVATG